MFVKNVMFHRSTKEISDIFNIPITTMTKGVKNFQEILNLDRKNKTRIKKITLEVLLTLLIDFLIIWILIPILSKIFVIVVLKKILSHKIHHNQLLLDVFIII